MGRGGIARDDDGLHTFVAQKPGDLSTVATNRVRALGAVWHACGVAEVDHALVRKLADDFFRDRESTDPRVEDADRRAVRRHHVRVTI